MLSISLNDPSPINPSYTHTEIGPPTIHTTTHLHATPDLTKIMFSISLNEPSPMNTSCTPSFIQTQNQNISHHTHCTIIWTPPYPSCMQATTDLPPVHLGYPVGGCGSVRSRLVLVAIGTCRVAFRQPEPAPTRTQPKLPTRIVLVYQITLPQLLVCIQWYHP
jgi:hypothetical protein